MTSDKEKGMDFTEDPESSIVNVLKNPTAMGFAGLGLGGDR